MFGIGGRDAAISTPRLALCTALAIATVLALGASKSGAATPADKAATYAYLHARYEFEKTIVGDSKETGASFASFAASLEAECRGVLSGAPDTEPASTPGPSSERQRGEATREREQLSAIELELIRSEFGAPGRREAAAAASLAAAVAPLRWSDPRIAAAIATQQAHAQLEPPPFGATEICADMRAWQQSGYRKLAPRTREVGALERNLLRSSPPEPSVESLLKPYEGPVEHALIHRIRHLETSYFSVSFSPFEGIDKHLRTALGIAEPKGLIEHKPIVLGRGTTRSGAKFKVTLESPRQAHRIGCRLEVSIEYEITRVAAEDLVVELGSGSNLCLVGEAADQRPVLGCESGQLTITQALDPSVSHVRLLLADGRTVTSPAIEIPAHRGGPVGLYVQALAKGSSRPVSLTELDTDGGVVRMQPIAGHRSCRIPRSREPLFVTLVHGTTPAGTAFQIEGSHGLSLGHGPSSVELLLDSGQEFGEEETIGKYPLEKTFPWSLGQECAPQEWAVVYGVLKSPGASVTAVTPTGEVPLTVASIPASLHPDGVLAYGAFNQIPSRLIVRDASGQVIAVEDLTSRVTQHREFCEGYAEP
jgi:hypothetical protein